MREALRPGRICVYFSSLVNRYPQNNLLKKIMGDLYKDEKNHGK